MKELHFGNFTQSYGFFLILHNPRLEKRQIHPLER